MHSSAAPSLSHATWMSEISLHVLAPIHSHAASVNTLSAVVAGVLIQADTLYAATARFIGLDDAVTITFHLGMFSFGHNNIFLIWYLFLDTSE